MLEPYSGRRAGIVLAAQSLSAISSRQEALSWQVAASWLAVLVVSYGAFRLLPGQAGRAGFSSEG